MSVSTILTSTCGIACSSAFFAAALAISAVLPKSASAATPVAVWDGDFSDSALTQNGWTLNRGWNATNATASAITIDRDNAGINIDTDTPLTAGITVIVRFSGLEPGSNERVLATSCVESSHEYDRTGIRLLADGMLRGCGNNSQNSGALSNYGTAANSALMSGYMAFRYRGNTSGASNVGTFIYFRSVDGTYPAASNWGTADLTYAADTEIYGVTIGGLRKAVSGWEAAKGMTINAIAVFNGALSVAEMNDFSFTPSSYSVTANTTVSAINAAMNGAGEINLTVSPGVEITLDEEFDAAIVRFASSGKVTLKSLVPPSPTELSKFYANDVQGAFIRTWLNPGVVGFNFTQNYGVDTSSALAEGEWSGDPGATSGSKNSLFFDGVSKITWDSTVYNTLDNSQTFLSGYLDDGNRGCNITVSAIPYETYDVIIYAATDTANCKFSPKTVNGIMYTCGNDGVAVAGSNGWGGSGNNTAAVYGTNAMRVNGLSGVLTINGGEKKTYDVYCRGGISAIQIMPTGATAGESEAVFDAKAGMTITDNVMKTRIRSGYRNVRFLGDGANGVLLDYGTTTAAFSSHIVFDGGTHTLKYAGTGSVVNLGNREGAPIFESANGATVNFYQHDLTGYSGAQIVATTDIRVDSGTTMNLIPYGTGTTYYRGRYTIEPGAVLTSFFSQEVNGGSTFRMHGGAVEGYEQIYVPASNSSAHAVINGDATSNGKLHIHTDATTGFGIFVGEGSTLDFDLALTSKDSNAPVAKWGAGTLNFNRSLSGYAGTLTVNEGTVQFGDTTIASLVNNASVGIVYGGEEGGQVIGTKITSYSGTGDINVTLTQDLLDEIESAPASGYTILPGILIRADRVHVGNAPAGYSVHLSENGIVLSNGTAGYPEWTGASNEWNASQFDGRQFSTDNMSVFFSQGEQPETAVTVAVNHAPTANSIAFLADDTAYTLSPHSGPNAGKVTSTGTLTVSGLAPVRVETPLEVAGISLAAGTEFTYANTALTIPNGALTGSGKFILDPGEGKTNTMSSANTSFTGEAVIASGTVKMGDKTAFGPLNRRSSIRVKGGATLSTGCNNGATEGETNRLILEEGATYTSYETINDIKLFPISHLELEGNANVVADVANVGITKHYNDALTIAMNGYTLTKTGANTLCIAAATLTGEGVLHIAAGTLNLNSGYYSDPQDECTFANGTIVVDQGATVHLDYYRRDATLSAKNIVLNGSVTQQTNNGTGTSTLTVTGYITGSGTTPTLILAEGAVFKPNGEGYLTITESLSGTMTIDLSNVNFAGKTVVPLFKVGQPESLPAKADIVMLNGIPRGWELAQVREGYKLRKQEFSITLR